ncbi:MAG TPA: hypothetical protein VIT92_10075 [Burkholderiaceae bacterium]
MEIQDGTDALRQYFNKLDPSTSEIESIHQADLAPEAAMQLMGDPKGALKALGVPVSDESVVNITMKNRASRDVLPAPASTDLAARAAARIRRIIVIVIHYRNCDSDVIIIANVS